MSCDRVASEGLLEGYLHNRLSEEDREAFERHYFECQRCFDDLHAAEAVRDELRTTSPQIVATTRSRPWLAAAGIAAVLVVGALAFLLRGVPGGIAKAVTTPASAPQQPPPIPPDADPVRPNVPPPSLEQLARAEPAPYTRGTFRTVPDDATARFQRGMERYERADYRAAIADLSDAATLDPGAPHVRFFLGVSQLLSGETNSAIDSLRATVALGDTPYLEESHLYLAKAFLRQGDVATAQTHLKQVVALEGPQRVEASRILEQIGRLNR